MEAIRPDLAPRAEEITRLRAVALGESPADLALRGGAVAFVHTGESMAADVLIAGRHIAAVTPPGALSAEATKEVDVSGYHLLPGFIEAHIHIDYCLLPPGELARLILPLGTTALFADPNCPAYVFGRKGVELQANTDAPLRLFLQISSAIPAFPNLEQGGEELTSEDILNFLDDGRTACYGESNPYAVDDHVLGCLERALANGRRITGHTARIDGPPLWGYLAGGVTDDHNAATMGEALERIRRGSNLALQSSSMTNYIADVLSDHEMLGQASNHVMFSADDKHADDLANEGHIDHHVRSAVALGVPPITAVRMATLNAASYFRVDHLIGSITPARCADILLIPDLTHFKPEAVWVGGEKVVESGQALFDNPDKPYPGWVHNTVNYGRQLTTSDFSVNTPESGDYTIRVMEMFDGYYKKALTEVVTVGDDQVVAPDPNRDLAKVAVIDRHKGKGLMGHGFLRGFGLRSGAVAVSTYCCNQNVIVVGASDVECAVAANRLADLGGGFVVVDDEKVIAEVPLRHGGTVSTEPFEILLAQLKTAKEAVASLGCPIESPFMILSFVGLAAVPELGLTELGLVDVATQEFVPVLVSA